MTLNGYLRLEELFVNEPTRAGTCAGELPAKNHYVDVHKIPLRTRLIRLTPKFTQMPLSSTPSSRPAVGVSSSATNAAMSAPYSDAGHEGCPISLDSPSAIAKSRPGIWCISKSNFDSAKCHHTIFPVRSSLFSVLVRAWRSVNIVGKGAPWTSHLTSANDVTTAKLSLSVV